MHMRPLSLFLCFYLLYSFNVSVSGDSADNPFTPKAYLIRYYKKKIANDLPKPWFLNKASPLSAPQSALFSKLASQNSLSQNLAPFCYAANLLCFLDLVPSLAKHDKDVNFATDSDKNFTNYGTQQVTGVDQFKKNSGDGNMVVNTFSAYRRDTIGHGHKFDSYGPNSNVVDQQFNTYGTKSVGDDGNFTDYGNNDNAPNQKFTPSVETSGGEKDFTSYSDDDNAGDESFSNYGNKGFGTVHDFTSYVIGLNFNAYSFTLYRFNGSVQGNALKNHGNEAFDATEKFTSYHDQPNASDDSFKDYGDKKSYTKSSQDKPMSMMSGKLVNKLIEPGKFFREAMLKEGTVMPMPDIRDKMPKRSFLPRVILSKLPFSSSKIAEMKQIFHAGENSSMEGMLVSGLNECERAPARNETKRCVGSAEDMIDFATSVLGRNIVVRTTENNVGSKGDILIRSVKGINGGKITKSVSCHQSMFPYLLYYCHSVPKVRVYEADILDTKTRNKVNHGVAICHVDTSAWSATHGAFLALESKPGKIEVCHWIFENDMTWVIAD